MFIWQELQASLLLMLVLLVLPQIERLESNFLERIYNLWVKLFFSARLVYQAKIKDLIRC